MDQIQTIVDKDGEVTAVVVPVAAWREIAEAVETHHLLRSPTIRQTVVEALDRGAAAARLKKRLEGGQGTSV